VFEQILSGADQPLRVVAELAETGIARTANQISERLTAMVVVDVQTLLCTCLLCRSFANRASFSTLYGKNDFFHLCVESAAT